MKENNVKNFLFMDCSKIDMYFSQLNKGKRLVGEKHSSTKITISVNPKIERETKESLRELTYYEKIQIIEKKIKYISLKEYDYMTDCRSKFIKGWFKLQKVLIPSIHPLENEIKSLSLWISPFKYSESISTSIYLIELIQDKGPYSFNSFTGYTALDFILRNLEETRCFRKSLLGIDYLPDVHAHDDPNLKLFEKFGNNPIKYLKNLGCHISEERAVCALFRVRVEFCDFRRRKNGMVGLIGYPLYIAD